MVAIVSFFVVLILSFIILRTGTVMLYLTGMSYEAAKFQARSSYTGTGFTSQESEMILAHPVRRKVVATLMLIGNIGFVSFVSSLIISIAEADSSKNKFLNIAYIAGGLLIIFLLSRSRLVDKGLRKIIEALLRRFSNIHINDYESLLNVSGKFEVIKIPVGDDSWLSGATLLELKLVEEGVIVLGIERTDGYYIGAPQGSSSIFPGDQVVLYGREKFIRLLADRKKGEDGDRAHAASVERYKAKQF